MALHIFNWLLILSLCILGVSAPSHGATGPVASYGFSEGNGSTTADASVNGQTGTITGATWTTAGRYGAALTFSGTNQVTVADTALLDLTSALTVSAWVYPTTGGDWRTVVMKEASGQHAYVLYSSDDQGRPAAHLQIGSTDAIARGTAALALNTWTHLAMTYDGAILLLYVNGVQTASRATTGATATSTQPLRIGGNAVWGEYFAGRIDEVRLYNRAQTAAEIQSDMATAIVSGPPPQPPAIPVMNPVTFLGVATLSWTYSPSGGTPTEYVIESNIPPAASWTETGRTTYSGPTSTWDISNMTLGAQYCFRVVAANAAGRSDPSKTICATVNADASLVCVPASCTQP